MPFEILDLQVEEISSVDSHSNNRTFIIIKRATPSPQDTPAMTTQTLAKAVENLQHAGTSTNADALTDIFKANPDLYWVWRQEHASMQNPKAQLQKNEGVRADIDRQVAQLQQRHPDWTIQQATEALFCANPQLYQRYRQTFSS